MVGDRPPSGCLSRIGLYVGLAVLVGLVAFVVGYQRDLHECQRVGGECDLTLLAGFEWAFVALIGLVVLVLLTELAMDLFPWLRRRRR